MKNTLDKAPDGLWEETRISFHPAIKGCSPGVDGYIKSRGLLSSDRCVTTSIKLDEIPGLKEGPVTFWAECQYKVWKGDIEGGDVLFAGNIESNRIQLDRH